MTTISEQRRADERLVAGYDALFDETERTAQRACLEYARICRPDAWPTPLDVTTFARVYGLSAAALGAFFGLIVQQRRGCQPVWIDTYRGPVHPHVNGAPEMTRKQAIAYGWYKAALATLCSETLH